MALVDNIVSYWKMDEASGNRADSVGSNTLTANGTGGVGSAAGKINDAADIESADDDYLSITDAAQTGLDILGNFTLSVWMKPESLSGAVSPGIVTKLTAGTGYAFVLDWSSAPAWKPTWVREDSSTPLQGASAPSVGNWIHYVWTFDGTDLRLYTNGALDGGPAAYTSHSDSGANFNIGRSVLYSSRKYDGLIDEVGVWSRAITAAEVTSLYNSGAGLTYPFTTSSTYQRRSNLALMGVS